jgi:hypothetical protein
VNDDHTFEPVVDIEFFCGNDVAAGVEFNDIRFYSCHSPEGPFMLLALDSVHLRIAVDFL